MPASIKKRELRFLDPVDVHFGFTGLDDEQARDVVKSILRQQWPEGRRPKQCVYVIRLTGTVAVAYPRHHSPVLYIGEGRALGRAIKHTRWLVPLLQSVPQADLQIRVVTVARGNHRSLYKYVEADLLREFSRMHGALPWFNKQWEPGYEGQYDYEGEAWHALRGMIRRGRGTSYKFAIKPTGNNESFEAYSKGQPE